MKPELNHPHTWLTSAMLSACLEANERALKKSDGPTKRPTQPSRVESSINNNNGRKAAATAGQDENFEKNHGEFSLEHRRLSPHLPSPPVAFLAIKIGQYSSISDQRGRVSEGPANGPIIRWIWDKEIWELGVGSVISKCRSGNRPSSASHPAVEWSCLREST